MNLICFPHYTCGGLLCDIFQGTFSKVAPNGGIASLNHAIGKIGDADEVFDNYDAAKFLSQLNNAGLAHTDWAGTHCWPGILSDTSNLNQVLVVTTTTFRSKIYRWVRAYHHYYLKSLPWLAVSGMDRIDKERETAKNYLKPFLPVTGPNVINIEFAEIVEQTQEFKNLVKEFDIGPHLARWQSLNSFLYANDIWNSDAVTRYYEAELEVNLNRYYIYE